MHRVKATNITGRPVFIDLDACPLIWRDVWVEERGPAGEVIKSRPCTYLATTATGANGNGFIEPVVETPEELFALPPVLRQPLGAIAGAGAIEQQFREYKAAVEKDRCSVGGYHLWQGSENAGQTCYYCEAPRSKS